MTFETEWPDNSWKKVRGEPSTHISGGEFFWAERTDRYSVSPDLTLASHLCGLTPPYSVHSRHPCRLPVPQTHHGTPPPQIAPSLGNPCFPPQASHCIRPAWGLPGSPHPFPIPQLELTTLSCPAPPASPQPQSVSCTWGLSFPPPGTEPRELFLPSGCAVNVC